MESKQIKPLMAQCEHCKNIFLIQMLTISLNLIFLSIGSPCAAISHWTLYIMCMLHVFIHFFIYLLPSIHSSQMFILILFSFVVLGFSWMTFSVYVLCEQQKQKAWFKFFVCAMLTHFKLKLILMATICIWVKCRLEPKTTDYVDRRTKQVAKTLTKM